METLVSKIGEKITTDSLRVALKFGKEHKHVMRDVRNLISDDAKSGSPKLGSEFFSFDRYLDGRGKPQPMIVITKKGFSLLAMGFTGEKALSFKIEFIEAFERMEQQLKKSSFEQIPNFGDPVAAAEAWIEKFKALQLAESTIEQQQSQISELEPIAQIGKNLAFKEGSVTIGTFAPLLGMGQNQLFKRLREDGILIGHGQRYNEPYSQYRTWFDLKPGELNEGPKKGKIWFQTRISIEGQKQLIKIYGQPIRLSVYGSQLKIRTANA
jgi:anti-repressor protein